MKKQKIYTQIMFTAAFFISFLTLAIILASPANGLTLTYAKTPPRIDGIFHYEEWNDATHVSFQLNVSSVYLNISEAHECELYITNDDTNLYLCLLVYEEDFNSVAPETYGTTNNWYGDQFWVSFYGIISLTGT